MAEAVLERDRALGWGLGSQPERLNIRTIDSVCAEIARSLPVLSGSGGRQSPVTDAGPLYAMAARRTFQLLGGEDEGLDRALRLVLLHRDGDLANCERLLAEMLGRRDQWADLVPLGFSRDALAFDEAYLDGTVLPRLERALELVVCGAIGQVERAIPRGVLERLTAAAAGMAHLEGYKGGQSPIAMCSGREAVPGVEAADLEHWRALLHLLVTPSNGTWRKSFAVNHLRVMDEVRGGTTEGDCRGSAGAGRSADGDLRVGDAASGAVSGGPVGGGEGAVSGVEPGAGGAEAGVCGAGGVRLYGDRAGGAVCAGAR